MACSTKMRLITRTAFGIRGEGNCRCMSYVVGDERCGFGEAEVVWPRHCVCRNAIVGSPCCHVGDPPGHRKFEKVCARAVPLIQQSRTYVKSFPSDARHLQHPWPYRHSRGSLSRHIHMVGQSVDLTGVVRHGRRSLRDVVTLPCTNPLVSNKRMFNDVHETQDANASGG